MAHSPALIGIETAVTDYIYDEKSANHTLRDGFLRFLKPEKPPRKGENILISAEDFDAKLLAFARDNGLSAAGDNAREQAESIRTQILGEPRTIEAGGALANSFYLMANAALNNKPLVGDATFFTSIGADVAGRVFADSLAGNIAYAPPKGRGMSAHIIPVDGDRIIIAAPSFLDSFDQTLSNTRELLKATDFSQTKLVMLGGYLHYTGHYNDFLQVVLDKVEACHDDPAKRPTIVLTAGAQAIAESNDLKSALDRARQIAPVIISANSGEFRRLMGRDSAWREPHQTKWRGQDGESLEKAKQGDAHYVQDKLAANDAAFAYAYETYCHDKAPSVTFVITNGKHGVHVVSSQGISERYIPPKPPHGIVNTVGGGDAFAGGYLLGQAVGLPEAQKVQLGFVAAGEVIGRDEARLPVTDAQNGARGLPAYLNPANAAQQVILDNLSKRAAQRRAGL